MNVLRYEFPDSSILQKFPCISINKNSFSKKNEFLFTDFKEKNKNTTQSLNNKNKFLNKKDINFQIHQSHETNNFSFCKNYKIEKDFIDSFNKNNLFDLKKTNQVIQENQPNFFNKKDHFPLIDIKKKSYSVQTNIIKNTNGPIVLKKIKELK